VYLLISCDSQNSQRLYPATALKDIQNGDVKVFCAVRTRFFFLVFITKDRASEE
jgi:hypothetical protein